MELDADRGGIQTLIGKLRPDVVGRLFEAYWLQRQPDVFNLGVPQDHHVAAPFGHALAQRGEHRSQPNRREPEVSALSWVFTTCEEDHHFRVGVKSLYSRPK